LKDEMHMHLELTTDEASAHPRASGPPTWPPTTASTGTSSTCRTLADGIVAQFPVRFEQG